MVYEESGPIQGDIWNAIVQVSADSKVDARFILAIIMQEVFIPSLLAASLTCVLEHKLI